MSKLRKILATAICMVMILSYLPIKLPNNLSNNLTASAAPNSSDASGGQTIYDILGMSTDPEDLEGYNPNKSVEDTPLGANAVTSGTSGTKYMLKLHAGSATQYGGISGTSVLIGDYNSGTALPDPFPADSAVRIVKSKYGNFGGQGEASGIASIYVKDKNLYLEFYDPAAPEAGLAVETIALTTNQPFIHEVNDKSLNKLYQIEVGDYTGDGMDDVAIIYALPTDYYNTSSVTVEIWSNRTTRWTRGDDILGWQKVYSETNSNRYTRDTKTRTAYPNQTETSGGKKMSNMISIATWPGDGRDELIIAYSYFAPGATWVTYNNTKLEKLTFDGKDAYYEVIAENTGVTRGGVTVKQVKNDVSVLNDRYYIVLGGTYVGVVNYNGEVTNDINGFYYSSNDSKFYYRSGVEFYDFSGYYWFCYGRQKSGTEQFSGWGESYNGHMTAPAAVMAATGKHFTYSPHADYPSAIVDFANLVIDGQSRIMNNPTIVNVDYSIYTLHSFQGQGAMLTPIDGYTSAHRVFGENLINPIHYMGTWKEPSSNDVLSRAMVDKFKGNFYGESHRSGEEFMHITVNNDLYHIPFSSPDEYWWHVEYYKSFTSVSMLNMEPKLLFNLSDAGFAPYSTGSSFTFIYDHYEVQYTDPDILAVLASPPYYKDLNLIDSSNASNSSTSYTTSTGSGSGASTSEHVSAGAYINISADAEVFGVTVARSEMEYAFETSRTDEFSNETVYTYSTTYGTTGGQDTVALYCMPQDVYYYRVYGTSNGVTMNGDLISYRVPRYKPIITTMSVEDYDELIANGWSVQPLKGSVIKHTVGQPDTYNYTATGGNNTFKDAITVGYGSAFVTTSIQKDVTTTETITKDTTISLKAGAGPGPTLVGASTSTSFATGKTTISFSGSEYSATVYDLPTDTSDASRNSRNLGYGFAYKMTVRTASAQTHGGANTSFPFVTYVLSDVSSPPMLPNDFRVEGTTESSVTLAWTPVDDNEDVRYNIYRMVAGTDTLMAGQVDGNTWTDTEVYSGVTYTYKIEAINPNVTKARTSIRSNGLSVVPVATPQKMSAQAKVTSPNTEITQSSGTIVVPLDASISLETNVSARTSGDRLYYQWQKRNINGEWIDINDEQAENYFILTMGNADYGLYRCRIVQIYQNLEAVHYTNIIELTDSSIPTLGLAATVVPQYGDALYDGEDATVLLAVTNPISSLPETSFVTAKLNKPDGSTQNLTQIKLSDMSSGQPSVIYLEDLPAGLYTITFTAPNGFSEEVLNQTFKVFEDPGYITQIPSTYKATIVETIDGEVQPTVLNSAWTCDYTRDIEGNTWLTDGSSSVLAVIPPAGYEIKSVTTNRGSIEKSTKNRYVLNSISGDATVSVVLRPITYNMTIRVYTEPYDDTIVIGPGIIDAGALSDTNSEGLSLNTVTTASDEISGANSAASSYDAGIGLAGIGDIVIDDGSGGGGVIVPVVPNPTDIKYLPFKITASYGSETVETSGYVIYPKEEGLPKYVEATLPVAVGGTDDLRIKVSEIGYNTSAMVEICDLHTGGNTIKILDNVDADGWFTYSQPEGFYNPLTVELYQSKDTNKYEILNYKRLYEELVASITVADSGQYTVVFADYDNGKLQNVEMVTFTAPVAGFYNVARKEDFALYPGGGDKIMLWNNLSQMKPLCPTW